VETDNVASRAALSRSSWCEEIVGDSAALRLLLDRVEQVATTDATVLVTGETGTGKEPIARAIHRRSPRAAGPLVKVNCAAKVSRGKIAGANGAARRLGMPASTLEFRIKKLAIDKYRFRNGH
jgi:transcriptional regulator with GAF, ATPase, and Fis domain